ncbi:MAG: ATP synthase subunit I [Deltaproteobacteria bacterium]|nr:ATP synthase subunit I [Deltaproteobacteria bacterium]
MNLTEKDPLQKRLEWTNVILLALLVVLSLLLRSPRFSLGVLCGGLISILNFHGLYRNLRSVFSKHLHRAKAALMVRYYLRLVLTALILYWVISQALVDVIGLVIGLSIVVLNIILTTVLVLSKKNRLEEVGS